MRLVLSICVLVLFMTLGCQSGHVRRVSSFGNEEGSSSATSSAVVEAGVFKCTVYFTPKGSFKKKYVKKIKLKIPAEKQFKILFNFQDFLYVTQTSNGLNQEMRLHFEEAGVDDHIDTRKLPPKFQLASNLEFESSRGERYTRAEVECEIER